MNLIELRSFEEYRNYQKSNREERTQLENRIIMEFEDNEQDFILGYCNVCEKETKFKLRLNKKKQIDFRESLVCEFCKINNRKRFMLGFLKNLAKNSDSKLTVFMYEQVTKFFSLAQNIKNINLIGTEFLGYDKKSGQIIDNIRNEDAMNLSFENNTFDVIVSNDVYEHVPNIERTLSEAYRVLKNSGKLLISIPFDQKITKTISRATLVDGKIKHLLPATYHENPIATQDGSLVFYDYGWDFFEFLKTAGFIDVYMLGYYDIFYGHLGNGLQFIFVAQK